MARKSLRVLLPAFVIAPVASQWREIIRYLKIEQMSLGCGHPQVVPAEGQHTYAKGSPAPDGTGDFQSASRGGPATTEPRPPRGEQFPDPDQPPGRRRERWSTPSSPYG